MTVGSRIKKARKEAGLTQQQLAGLAGIANYQHIGRWERGERQIELANLKKLAKALNKTLEELAGD